MIFTIRTSVFWGLVTRPRLSCLSFVVLSLDAKNCHTINFDYVEYHIQHWALKVQCPYLSIYRRLTINTPVYIFKHSNMRIYKYGTIIMKPLIRVMKALSDPNRVTILKLLAHKELCVCELTALLGLAQPTVSKHLKTLEDAGFVDSTRTGAWVIYRLATPDEATYVGHMLNNLEHWLNDDERVTLLVEKLPQVDRERICAA